MVEIISGIYQIKNLINNNFYVGSSCHIKRRWWTHVNKLNNNVHHCQHLQNAWNKYGKENFVFEILDEIDEVDLLLVEQVYLDKFWDGGINCYNSAKVSDRPDADLNKLPIKQLDSCTNEIIKIWPSAADVQKELGFRDTGIYACCKGRSYSSFGYRWQYQDDELSVQSKDYEFLGKGSYLKRKVSQFSLDNKLIKEYNSIAEASRETDIKASGISYCCLGTRDTAGGFKFSYNSETKVVKDNNENFQCKLCFIVCNNLRSLASHLQTVHEIKSIDYTIKCIYGGAQPTCLNCGKETRYTTFSFKRYCKECSYVAESEAGKIGGSIKTNWNKGLTKKTDKRIAQQALNMMGEKNHFFNKTHSMNVKKDLSTEKLLSEEEFLLRTKERDDIICLSLYSDYIKRQQEYLLFLCKKCNKTQLKTLMAWERKSQCDDCFPKGISKPQIDVLNFVKSLGFVDAQPSERSIIDPKELDVYVPSKSFAIEYNGLYWHSEARHDNKNSHVEKLNLCEEKSISLIHVFSDEWENKQEICKSIISHKLGASKVKIFARKTKIKSIDKLMEKEWFNKTHISGYARSVASWGLFYEGKLVTVISVRRPFQQNTWGKNTLEIARYSCELNTSVVGGLGKLMKEVINYAKNNSYEKILTYADLRYGVGNGYKKVGFTFNNRTTLNWWWTNGTRRIDRFQIKAKDGVPEKEMAIKFPNGPWYKIYGCGNAVYIMDTT